MSDTSKELRFWRILGIVGLITAVAAILVGVAVAGGDGDGSTTVESPVTQQYPPEKALMKGADEEMEEHAPDPDAPVESYERPDPTLPAVPAGKVKRFRIDTAERLTRVSDEKPALRAWTFGVNGKMLTGTGGSPPIVVNEGDDVELTIVNGASEEMEVHFPHSVDTHAAEVSPQKAYADAKPGEQIRYRFKATHPGVFMYHCGTKPVLRHVGAGMAGTMIVRPRGLPAVDRELWITQQEFYLGEPKGDASVEKMVAKKPDVIAFNGFASQYLKAPIAVKRGERIRIWVLNGGPSSSSYFHVIGTVFDRVWSEGDTRRDAQTMALGPSEGGFVEFTLDEEGNYPFVTHAFGDMVRGAIGALKTENAPEKVPSPAKARRGMSSMGHGEGGHTEDGDDHGESGAENER